MTNVAATNVTAAGVIADGPVVLAGVILALSGAGTIKIYDNASAATGTVLFTATLAAAGHVHFDYPGNGVQALNGLFLAVSAGTIEGSVLIA